MNKLLLALAIVTFGTPAKSQNIINMIGEDGFEWCKLVMDGKEGASDKHGKIIIPTNYGVVFYSNSVFHVYDLSMKKKGIIDKMGKHIIPLNRGYENITYYEGENVVLLNHSVKIKEVGYYKIVKEGKTGACDMSGEEVVKPLYEDIDYYYGFRCTNATTFEKQGWGYMEELNIYLDGNGYLRKSTNIEQDKHTNNMFNGFWDDVNIGQKYIENQTKDFWKNVDPATLEQTVPVQNGGIVGGSTNGTMSGGSGSSVMSGLQCRVCGGTGRKISLVHPGNATQTKWCSECNKTVGTGHFHTQCDNCRGTGRIK